MGIKKHDTNDNLEGLPKAVKGRVMKEMAKQAQEQKNIDQNHPYSKNGQYLGNGGTR